jgi:hypothetical protein
MESKWQIFFVLCRADSMYKYKASLFVSTWNLAQHVSTSQGGFWRRPLHGRALDVERKHKGKTSVITRPSGANGVLELLGHEKDRSALPCAGGREK